jgi:hypothetical protein
MSQPIDRKGPNVTSVLQSPIDLTTFDHSVDKDEEVLIALGYNKNSNAISLSGHPSRSPSQFLVSCHQLPRL